jgi:hypothetical protein
VNSSSWPSSEEERKVKIQKYLLERAEIPCKYFELSVQRWEASGRDHNKLHCRSGNHCHYRHYLPGRKGRYMFSPAQVSAMIQERERLRQLNPRFDSVGDSEFEQLGDYYNVDDDDEMGEFPEIEPPDDLHLEQIRRIEELERNYGHLSSRDLRQRAVQVAIDIMEIRARRGREELERELTETRQRNPIASGSSDFW